MGSTSKALSSVLEVSQLETQSPSCAVTTDAVAVSREIANVDSSMIIVLLCLDYDE